MVDKGELLELAAHYVVILVIVTIALAAIQSVVDLGFWAELAVIVVIVAVYRPAVKALGMEPSAWHSE
ncbi:hypothetical protein [Halosimplex sp. TS25]|uniref:hypothetical protein n=1 Tax=Halosimplex rarum TaxID=3396619 RepID=UPI0039ED5102